jgi:hypothetical protein
MTEDHLNGLAHLYIRPNRDVELEYGKVIEEF